MTGTLSVFACHEEEVEAQFDQVGDMTVFGVVGDGCCVYNGLYNAKGVGLFSFYQKFLDANFLKLKGEASVQSSV